MPRVRLKLNCWLSRGVDADSNKFDDIPIIVPKGESLLGMIRRLSTENEVFRREIFDEEHQMIQAHVVVLLNGRIVNLYERSEPTLKEGDVVTFLPMMYGG